MKFLSLLLGMVIFVAVLYQSVFTPALNTSPNKQVTDRNSPALQTLKQAQELKDILNKQTDKGDYKERLEQL